MRMRSNQMYRTVRCGQVRCSGGSDAVPGVGPTRAVSGPTGTFVAAAFVAAAFVAAAFVATALVPGEVTVSGVTDRGTGLAAESVWELYEWAANNMSGAGIPVGYADMLVDLLMGGFGALPAGLTLAAWVARNRGAGEAEFPPYGRPVAAATLGPRSG